VLSEIFEAAVPNLAMGCDPLEFAIRQRLSRG
jgi:hypothetical protein